MHEMLPRLLAVANDVDTGILLELQREQRGVVFGIRELVAFEPPRRSQPVRRSEPPGLRQAAGDSCRK
jgi:hypothetical protein